MQGIRNVTTHRYGTPRYLESDVKRAALLKHGSLAGVEEAVERSGQKALDKRQKTVDQRAARQLEANAACAGAAGVVVGCAEPACSPASA